MVNEPPYWLRCKLIDLSARQKRAAEEMLFSKKDMQQTHDFFSTMHRRLLQHLTDTSLSAGERALVLKKLLLCERRCLVLEKAFSQQTKLNLLTTFFTTDPLLQATDADIGADIAAFHNIADVPIDPSEFITGADESDDEDVVRWVE